jgi:hypothetical protein
LNQFAKCGTDSNLDKVTGVQWNHFYFELPSKFVNNRDIDSVRGKKRTNKETLMRSLEELTIEAITDPEKLKEFKDKHEDSNRTSMSSWVKVAWKLADRF